MKKLSIKKSWLIFPIVLVLLMIGNPNKKQFKEYVGGKGAPTVRREHNFLIFSYWVQEFEYGCDKRYLSIAWNFFRRGCATE